MLIDNLTGRELKIGDTVETFNHGDAVITDIADLVYVKTVSGTPTKPYGVYPGAIGARVIPDDKK